MSKPTIKNTDNLRKILLRDIENRLIKVFVDNGFVVFPLTPEEQKSPEIKKAFPLGRLKRTNDKILEIVEIQFDKHGKAKFVINFGVVPEAGVTLPWTHIEQNNADVSALSEAYRLYSQSLFPNWFELGILSEKTEENVKKLVDKAIALYPEIETWFSSKVVGKHMRKFGFNP